MVRFLNLQAPEADGHPVAEAPVGDRARGGARMDREMTVSVLVRVCGVLALLALSGCARGYKPPAADPAAAPSAEWTTYSDASRGYSVGFPMSWHRADERLSRITEPREILTLGTLSLSWRETDCEAFAGAAGMGMGRGDVVITVWERGYDRETEWADFPARPWAFGPVADAEPAGPGCGEPPGTMIHWRNFTDSGRHLHTMVRIGAEAPPRARAEAWQILDSLRLDAGYRPAWAASG